MDNAALIERKKVGRLMCAGQYATFSMQLGGFLATMLTFVATFLAEKFPINESVAFMGISLVLASGCPVMISKIIINWNTTRK